MCIYTEDRGSYVINRGKHKFSLNDVLDYVRENVEQWADKDVVWDLTQLKMGYEDSESMRRLVHAAATIAKIREGKKTALITNEDLVYGMMRMLQMMAEGVIDIEINVLRNEKSAISWITANHEDEK